MRGEGIHSIDMFHPDYIVGLVDGEGSFTVYIRNPRDTTERKRRVKAEPKFYIKLVQKDREVLEALKKYFGCGNVYFQKDNRKNHQHCYRYEVASRNDLEKIIIPFFQKHSLRFPSKKKDFKIFCQLMHMIKKQSHLYPSGLQKMFDLKSHMH